MADDGVVALLLVALADELGDGHGTMPAAGTAHADREVRLALSGVPREQEIEEWVEPLQILRGPR